MVDRIFIGKKEGSQLLRISKPTFDVNDKANPMIFSSENNYLKIHHRNTLQLSKYNQSGNTFWQGRQTFPALDYYPLVWYHFRSPQLDATSIRFPVQDNDVFWDYGCAHTMNEVWFSCANTTAYGGATVYVDYVIFNVRME